MQDFITTSEITLLVVGKFGIIVFLVIYVIFAAIIIKQVRMMTETLDLGLETQIKAVVFLHFIFSLVVLSLSLIVL